MYNPILQDTIERVKRDNSTIFVPNPQGGRVPNRGSVTYWLRQILAENDGIKAYDLANKIISQANEGSHPHQNIVLERTDGAIASEVNVKGVLLHVGDEYASLGMAAMKAQLNRQQELLNMPQESTELPLISQTSTDVSSGENDTDRIDEH